VREIDDLTTFIVPIVEKIRSLKFRFPKDLLRPLAGKLYLYLTNAAWYRAMYRS
jgi:hypothetical protein